MPNISIRISETDEQNLDALVIAVRAYYERVAAQNSPFAGAASQLAREVTRSSALRDLLLAWKRGEANDLFSCNLTKEIT